jgi:hypothetical protein
MVDLDRRELRTLANLQDDIAVISVFVTDEWNSENARRAAGMRLRQELDRAARGARHDDPRRLGPALASRLDDITIELQRLATTAAGLGRALFAPLSRDELHVLSLQHPLPNRVIVEPSAYIRPLVSAWSLDGPAGVAVVSSGLVRLVDLRLGRANEVESYAYVDEADRRQVVGPSGANPALPFEASSQNDLYERRERDRIKRFLARLAPAVADVAGARDWEYLVVSGDPELAGALISTLPEAWPGSVVRTRYELADASPHRVAEVVRDDLAAARRARATSLAEQIRDGALAGGKGALGLGETLGALQQGRVAHLLLDDSRTWRASRTPDGYLAPEGEVPPWTDAGQLVPEASVDERMIELAINSDAQVTLAEPAAVEPLADFDGVGAVLRW